MNETPCYKQEIPLYDQNFAPVNFMEDKITDIPKVELSLFSVIRNCGKRVREWLAFHKAVGIERFIIVLHDCLDNTEDEIKRLPFGKDIVLHHMDVNQKLPQLGAYQRLLDDYKDTTKWITFLDDDEFLYSPIEDDIKKIVRLFKAYGGVVVNWQWFGSNNHVLSPTGLVIESYTKKATTNYIFHRGCKSIVQSKAVHGIISPHIFITNPVCVNEEYEPLVQSAYWKNGPPPAINLLRVNHYKVKSMEDWVMRVQRGDCTLKNPAPVDVERFKAEDRNDVEDTDILRFVEQVKSLMG